jgi:hypothetical protein
MIFLLNAPARKTDEGKQILPYLLIFSKKDLFPQLKSRFPTRKRLFSTSGHGL